MQEDKNHKYICIYQHCLKFCRLLIVLCIHDKIIRKIQCDFVLIHSSLTKGTERERERVGGEGGREGGTTNYKAGKGRY